MPPSLADLVDPAHTVVVTQECQRGVLGEPAIFPELATAAREAGLVEAVARLVEAARAVDVAVVHCVAARREDGRGSNDNALLFDAATRADVKLLPGSPAVEVLPELGPAPTDLVLTRLHGLGPMGGTDLDPVLRNLGARTIVAVGVSINVGMTDLVFDAVNGGYRVVLPRDGIAGIPQEYADAVIEHTLRLLATLTTVDEIVANWTSGPGDPRG
ncbi:MAG: cysteine hydrolase [Actinobacteria bacterium]|nr:cysteine hydrolase [Actinomycetota bacterium]